MQALLDVMPQIAESSSTVLIEGESGTGKELLARAMHDLSPRRDRRLVAVNCGAFPDTLLESELFGYKAGAFTDARKDKPGRFALAQGGTLFLDEIGDISAGMQAKLLRVLQEGVYEPLGAVESIASDVRIIAATNQNLARLVMDGKFREDLYYRVNVVRLELPPLRERREDIPVLVEHFISKFNCLQHKHVRGVSEQVMAILLDYDFPGNIRELENIIEHAFVLLRGELIETRHLPASLREKAGFPPVPEREDLTLAELEALHISETMRRHAGNRAESAKALGIHRATLFRKIKSLGLELPGAGPLGDTQLPGTPV
jgi:transcriptional regulator with PAS, ATPase and Fis domain